MSNIESVSNETRIFEPPAGFVAQANVKQADFDALNAAAAKDFTGFWAKLARDEVLWKKPFTRTLDESNAPFYKWFDDGELNVSYNCLDRNLENGNAEKVAIIFEADDGTVTRVTYRDLYHRVCRFANALKRLGIRKGDRVLVYMPMSIEGVVAMQACARIGATHSVVFGGFSAKSLQERIIDAGAVAVITADEQARGGKHLPLKAIVDEALGMGGCESIRNVIVYRRTGGNIPFAAPRDVWMHEVTAKEPDTCEPEWVGAEHPLFILYTSGSTGKPKGVQHSSGGYLLWAMLTMRWTFDIKPTDVFWCTADIGWVTGHTYIAYGPLAVGATEIVFEGVPTYPDAGRFWQTIAKHKVSIFYTAPTAIRSLIKASGVTPATRAEELRSVVAAPARHRRRADQSRGVDVVPRQRRRRPLPDRRHVVADRDRRPHDHAAARRHAARSGLVHAAAARHHGRDRRRDRPRRRERTWRHPRDQAPVAGDDPHDLGRSGPLPEILLPRGARRQALSRR